MGGRLLTKAFIMNPRPEQEYFQSKSKLLNSELIGSVYGIKDSED